MYLRTGLWPQIDTPNDEALESVIRTLSQITADDDFVIYSSEEKPNDYLQARPDTEDTFRVEYRDWSIKRHYKRNTVPVDVVIALFHSYRRQDGAWRDMVVWQDISDCFDDLRRKPRPVLPRKATPPSWFQQVLSDEKL